MFRPAASCAKLLRGAPGFARDVWRSYSRLERALLVACLAVVLLCLGWRWSRRAAPLPPFFRDAPAEPSR